MLSFSCLVHSAVGGKETAIVLSRPLNLRVRTFADLTGFVRGRKHLAFLLGSILMYVKYNHYKIYLYKILFLVLNQETLL